MPRSPRIVEPNGIYHLTPRGNNRRTIFTADRDRLKFLALLTRVTRERRWIVFGYCLMDNHVHLLVQVPELGLSEGMQELLGRYAQWSNREYGRFGHLFVNRFPSETVCSDAHLLGALRYVDLNPVRAGLTTRPEDWPWSSYRAHVGLEHPLPLLANDRFLGLFGSTPDTAREVYREFVRAGFPEVSDPALSARRDAA